MTWNADLDLGHAQMDDTHREFVAAVNQLAEATDGELPMAVDALIAHCEPHFAQEDAWCEQVGMPPCHRGEHARVLELLYAVRTAVRDQGQLAVGRSLAEALPEWFQQHATGMDAALAAVLNSGMTVPQLQTALAQRQAQAEHTAA